MKRIASFIVFISLFDSIASAQAPKKEEDKKPTPITKERLLGEWEGKLKDGTIVALKFTEKLVVVSILASGTNRGKAREAAEWASGNVGRALSGGGFGIGSMDYEIAAEKNEVKVWGAEAWSAAAQPTKDGTLLVSGRFKISNADYTVPETRIERVKSPDAKK